jgi:hypothetical protein
VQATRQRFWRRASNAEQETAAEKAANFQRTLKAFSSVHPPRDFTNVCGVMLPCRSNPTSPSKTAFVRTTASITSLHAAALAVDAAVPILLSGSSGSGKSSLAAELAAVTGNTDMLQLFMDDLMDARSLLGAYVCTSTPGEFRWQAGPLAQARLLLPCCSMIVFTVLPCVCVPVREGELTRRAQQASCTVACTAQAMLLHLPALVIRLHLGIIRVLLGHIIEVPFALGITV